MSHAPFDQELTARALGLYRDTDEAKNIDRRALDWYMSRWQMYYGIAAVLITCYLLVPTDHFSNLGHGGCTYYGALHYRTITYTEWLTADMTGSRSSPVVRVEDQWDSLRAEETALLIVAIWSVIVVWNAMLLLRDLRRRRLTASADVGGMAPMAPHGTVGDVDSKDRRKTAEVIRI